MPEHDPDPQPPSASFDPPPADADPKAIWYYPRGSRTPLKETVMGERFIKWAYQSADLKGIRSLAFRLAIPSAFLGWYFGSRLSHKRIRIAIDELEIDESEFRDPTASFRTFHDFFTRHLKPEARPWDRDPEVFACPADGRVLVWPRLRGAEVVPAKGVAYTADALLDRPAPEFHDGAAMVVRLCPADYHRYHFPCAGEVIESRAIDGAYHSVNPIPLALGLNVFCENKRFVTTIQTERFGKVAYVEVGAFGVGSINQTWTAARNGGVGERVEKMQEKGYFTFGGSTLVLLVERGGLSFSPDLLAHSAAGYETLVKVGETIGSAGEGVGA